VQSGTLTQLIGHIERLAETHRAALAGAVQDDIGESLHSAVMDLTWVGQHIASSSDEYNRRLKRAGQSLANCLTLKRTLIEGLRPSGVTCDIDVVEALDSLMADKSDAIVDLHG
jgi:signal transduction histidine kinase